MLQVTRFFLGIWTEMWTTPDQSKFTSVYFYNQWRDRWQYHAFRTMAPSDKLVFLQYALRVADIMCPTCKGRGGFKEVYCPYCHEHSMDPARPGYLAEQTCTKPVFDRQDSIPVPTCTDRGSL